MVIRSMGLPVDALLTRAGRLIRPGYRCLLTILAWFCLMGLSHAEPAAPLTQRFGNPTQAQYAVQWAAKAQDVAAARADWTKTRDFILVTKPEWMRANPSPLVYVGFFAKQQDAEKFVADHQHSMNNLKVVPVSPAEHALLFNSASNDLSNNLSKSSAKTWLWIAPSQQDQNASARQLMSEAKTLYMDGQYTQALDYYALLSLSSDRDIALWSRELMGLSYERLGHPSLAQTTYQGLLTEFPKHAITPRVKQRLHALETASLDLKEARREPTNTKKPYAYRGFIGQSYLYAGRGGKWVDDQDVMSAIATQYNLNGRYGWGQHQVEAQLNGYDLMDLNDDVNSNTTQIKRLYLDYLYRPNGLKITGGRQRDFDSGQYLYFDGVTVKYPLKPKWTLGASAGVPVQFSDFYDYMDRQFYSLQTQYQWNAKWNFAGYLTQQTLYSETDRAAYGGRAQYLGQHLTSFLNLDYDYEFNQWNLMRWQGSYQFNSEHQVTLEYGRQRNPFLSATNLLLGQPYLDLETYLNNSFNRDYLHYYALERTAQNEYGSISYRWDADDHLEMVTDIYRSVSTSLPYFATDDGLTNRVQYSDTEYTYTSAGLQALIKAFFGYNDLASLGVRLIDTNISTSAVLSMSERVRFFKNKLFLMPSMQLKFTERDQDGAGYNNIRGSLTLGYYPWRNTEFRFEAGNERYSDLEAKNNLDMFYINAGYNVRF